PDLATFWKPNRRQLGPHFRISLVARSRLSHSGRLFSFWSRADRAALQWLQWVRRRDLFDAMGRQLVRRTVRPALTNAMELPINDRWLLARADSSPSGCNRSRAHALPIHA